MAIWKDTSDVVWLDTADVLWLGGARASLTLPILTVDSTGLLHGVSSLTLPVLEASSLALNHGDSSIVLPQFTTDLAGHSQVNGAMVLPQFSLSAFSSPGIVDLTLPLITVDSTGLLHGVSSVTLPLLSLNALALNHGDSSLNLPVFTLNGVSFNHGDSDLTLPIPTVSSTSRPGINAASITLPLLTLDAQGHLAVDGSITLPILEVSAGDALGGDITLAMLTLSARAVKGSIPDCVVMNTINNAVSEYKGYWFNSYTKFNGVYLGANQNGIYEQDTSDTDNAGLDDFKIKAHIKTGVIDTENGSVQRLRNAWLTFETDGDIRIRTQADEQVTRDYHLAFQGLAGIKERRVKFERGIKESHFDFKVENVNGSDLGIDKLTIALEPISSKRR